MANVFGRDPFIEKWELKYHTSWYESSQEFWLKNFKGKPKFRISRHKQNKSLIFLEAYWETKESIFNIHAKKFWGHDMSIMSPSFNEAQLMHSWSSNIIRATLDLVEGADTLGSNHQTLSQRIVLWTRPANSLPGLHLSQTRKTLQLHTWWWNENAHWLPVNNLST